MLGYSDGPGLISRVLKRQKREAGGSERCEDGNRGGSDPITGRGTGQGSRNLLEPGKGRETVSLPAAGGIVTFNSSPGPGKSILTF